MVGVLCPTTLNNAFSGLFLIIFVSTQWELGGKNYNVFLATWASHSLVSLYFAFFNFFSILAEFF